jgi:hypothetical protein
MYQTDKVTSTAIQASTLCLLHEHSIEHLLYAIHADIGSSVWSVVGATDAVKVVVGGQNVLGAIPFGLGVASGGRLEAALERSACSCSPSWLHTT